METNTYKCCRCQTVKPDEEFYVARTAKGSRKRQTYCKECAKAASRAHHVANPVAKRAANERWAANNPERRAYLTLKSNLKKFNLTPEQFYTMLEAQGGVCAICGGQDLDGKRLAVDHDHACCPARESCGLCVRGLLCTSCNTAVDHVGQHLDALTNYCAAWGVVD